MCFFYHMYAESMNLEHSYIVFFKTFEDKFNGFYTINFRKGMVASNLS